MYVGLFDKPDYGQHKDPDRVSSLHIRARSPGNFVLREIEQSIFFRPFVRDFTDGWKIPPSTKIPTESFNYSLLYNYNSLLEITKFSYWWLRSKFYQKKRKFEKKKKIKFEIWKDIKHGLLLFLEFILRINNKVLYIILCDELLLYSLFVR